MMGYWLSSYRRRSAQWSMTRHWQRVSRVKSSPWWMTKHWRRACPSRSSPCRLGDFALLGEFEYPVYVKLKEGEELPEIPAEVRALDGKNVAITGFMNPVRFDREGVSEFLLVKDILGCCFGATPRMNHWIRVRMKEGKRAKFYAYDQLTVLGKLEVSEELEDGYVMSIYRMTVHHLSHEE